MNTSDLMNAPTPVAPSPSTADVLKEELLTAFKKAGYKGMVVMLSPSGGIHPVAFGLNYLELVGVSKVCADRWLAEMGKANSGHS